jgi:hypothetical protein
LPLTISVFLTTLFIILAVDEYTLNIGKFDFGPYTRRHFQFLLPPSDYIPICFDQRQITSDRVSVELFVNFLRRYNSLTRPIPKERIEFLFMRRHHGLSIRVFFKPACTSSVCIPSGDNVCPPPNNVCPPPNNDNVCPPPNNDNICPPKK